MDLVKLVEIFRQTLDKDLHDQAEKQLEQIHKIIGFLPTVLQIIMESSLDISVRQAAALYFKNEVGYYWQEKKEPFKGEPIPYKIPYTIHEQDRALIRNSIVDALVLSPPIINNSLSTALHYVIKFDFPDRWTGIVDKIVYYLQTSDPKNWFGALTALLQLTKNYEYQTNIEKAPLLDAMKILAPILYKMMIDLLPDQGEHSVLMQKTILKNIFILTQYSLPLSLFTQEFFTKWMEIIVQVLDRPVPDKVNSVDIEERRNLPWYKAKKWALHIITRIFERYGPNKEQSKEYKSFGKWYMETFSLGMIQVILKMLDQYNQKIYIPPRVLQQCINYLNTCVEHMHTWKILKANISQIIEKVIFPLMCYSEEDDELWNSDPEEYVRKRFDFFEDYVSPVSAAKQFLSTCCKKRKDMLSNTIRFAIQVLNSDSIPQFKDGALHMLGSVSDIMLRKKIYHQQINDMLGYHVFPYFNSDQPFLRARAAWILHFFENFEFDNDMTLFQAVNCLQNALIHDKELPVKVQAAISFQMLIISQEKTKHIVEPNLETIIIECLNLVKISQNDDVCNGLQRVICSFGDKILPISVKIVENLVCILEELSKNTDENNDSTITIMGLLNTIDTVLMLVDDKDKISVIEPYAMKSVLLVLNQDFNELYEEAFNIVTTLTDKSISNEMWKIYEYMFQIATKKEEGVDYYSDMLPAIHNFLTVDPDAFISDPNRVAAFYEISKTVLSHDSHEEIHVNAIKMIEVFFLQYREKVANSMPSFCELVWKRYLHDLVHNELRNQCILVMLVVLYINSELFFAIMDDLQKKYPTQNINIFLREWLVEMDRFEGLHERKVCVLALCKLLALLTNQMPSIQTIVHQLAPEFMPELLKLFNNLKGAYKAKAIADAESSDSDSEYSSISSDEEDANDDFNNSKEMDDGNYFDDDGETGSEDDDDNDDDNELTPLENFETTIDKEDSHDDEYVLFRQTVEFLKQQNQNFYTHLFGNLNQSQISILEDVFVLAVRRQNAAESRKIEQAGGYIFNNQTVPTTFNFGGNSFINPK